jgi:DNA-directed RNA polymerase specialized sigma24 family protein
MPDLRWSPPSIIGHFMSPASLRRYRAERLLRDEFRALRGQVIASVRASLRAHGAGLDESDLDACYAQAWHGLYAATLEGQRIVNPAGWLAVVTFRRAIDEQRARARIGLSDGAGPAAAGCEDDLGDAGAGGAAQPDFATELDDRIRLRHLFEALRLRLSAREQQAAALCYLQGLTRAQAARMMGVGEARMRKLMDGPGAGRPGVAGKVGALVGTIRDGEWCAEQGSLMRGFAYGILDPAGERYRLALAHSSSCPACRAYVASLRGLAALLPPAPAILHWALLGGAVGARAASQGATAGSALPGAGAVSSPVAASGAAMGVGAGGGSWLLAGGVSTKLATSCLLALGVGAGCAVLGAGGRAARAPAHARARPRAAAPPAVSPSVLPAGDGGRALSIAMRPVGAARGRAAAALAPSSAIRASREFGPEQALATPTSERSRAPAPSVSARAATAGGEFARAGAPPARIGAGASAPARAAGASAQREFSPG